MLFGSSSKEHSASNGYREFVHNLDVLVCQRVGCLQNVHSVRRDLQLYLMGLSHIWTVMKMYMPRSFMRKCNTSLCV